MRKRRFLGLVSVGCAVVFSTSNLAWATTVEPSQGVVLLNSGKGFKQIKKPMKVHSGSSVMVSPDGAAKVVYSDGCKVDVHPGEVTAIAELSPCASGSSAQDGDGHWGGCRFPPDPTSYCATIPVTAAVLAVFGGITYLAISP